MSAATETFLDYWNAVDAAMQEHFGLDTDSAGIPAEVVADGHAGDWSPEEFAFWCGENYRLIMLCELGG